MTLYTMKKSIIDLEILFIHVMVQAGIFWVYPEETGKDWQPMVHLFAFYLIVMLRMMMMILAPLVMLELRSKILVKEGENDGDEYCGAAEVVPQEKKGKSDLS